MRTELLGLHSTLTLSGAGLPVGQVIGELSDKAGVPYWRALFWGRRGAGLHGNRLSRHRHLARNIV